MLKQENTKELRLTAYESPKIETLGSVQDLTAQELDKVGTSADFLTALLPDLTGTIQPDVSADLPHKLELRERGPVPRSRRFRVHL